MRTLNTLKWIAGLAAGSLVLVGTLTADPLSSLARQDATPAQGQEGEDDDDGEGTPVVGTPLLRPAIDVIAAQEIAPQDQAGAAVREVGLEGDDGVLVYEVTLDNGTEVEIDAATGAVLETEQGDDEDEDDDEEDEDEDE